MQHLFDDLKIISIVDFSLNEFNNGLLSLDAMTLTFVADQGLLRSFTFNTEDRDVSHISIGYFTYEYYMRIGNLVLVSKSCFSLLLLCPWLTFNSSSLKGSEATTTIPWFVFFNYKCSSTVRAVNLECHTSMISNT